MPQTVSLSNDVLEYFFHQTKKKTSNSWIFFNRFASIEFDDVQFLHHFFFIQRKVESTANETYKKKNHIT